MKLGLALGGGGANGSYQIGVLKALIETGLLNKLKVVSGTSIGAFNACLVMERLSFDKMHEMWLKIDNQNVYGSIDRFKQDKLGLFDQTKMYNTLITHQDKEVLNKSDIKGFVIASKIKELKLLNQVMKSNLEETVFYLNKLKDPHRAVLASASIPIIFGPTQIEDTYYVDGGLLNNLPVKQLVDEGCNVLFTVSLDHHYNLDEYKDDYVVVDFTPTTKLSKTFLGVLNFSEEALKNKIDLGYSNALSLIEQLKEEGIIKNNKIDKNKKGIYYLK